jgi:hypothetical protein
MASQNPSPQFSDRRKPPQLNQPKDYGWTLYLIIVTLAMAAGVVVARDGLYKPGDDIGYYIGLAGGLMMLTLLFYPIRKRVGFMKNWIILPKWFKWHMAFGILGPALIMFHSTFYIGSINAGVALVCMMLVSGSGIFGRFFYTKIHYGLYGRKASFDYLQQELEGKDVAAMFAFAPGIQKQLAAYRDYAIGSIQPGGRIGIRKFVTLGPKAKLLQFTLVRELERAMYANPQNWNGVQRKLLDEMFAQNKTFIRDYLQAVQELGQFGTYEKLFSLWHVFHVPLVYMLVFSAIWHVIAVHMY